MKRLKNAFVRGDATVFLCFLVMAMFSVMVVGNTLSAQRFTDNSTVTDNNTGLVWLLVLSKSGTGSGTVTSSPAGISCGNDCTEPYTANTSVTLTATADTGSSFTGWGDACSSCGANATCSITMDANKSCTAAFNSSSSPVQLGFVLPNGSSFAVADTVKIGLQVSGGSPDATAAIYLKYLQASNSWVDLWNQYISANGIFSTPTPILSLLLPIQAYNLDCSHSPCFMEFPAALLGEGQHAFEAFLAGLPGPSAVSPISNVARTQIDIHAASQPQPQQYTISASVNPAAAGSISCNPNPVTAGSTSSCSITANSGYTISSLTGTTCGGTLNGNVFTTNAVSANCTVVANLAQEPSGTFLVGNWTAERMSSSGFIGSGPWTFNSDGTFVYDEQQVEYRRHVFKGTWSYANGQLSYRYEEETGYDLQTGQIIRHCVVSQWPNAVCDVGTPATDTFYSGSATVLVRFRSFIANEDNGLGRDQVLYRQ